MTKKIYLECPELTLTAMVTHSGKDKYGPFVELDETVFHPQGGGQKADRGTLAGLAVVHVAKNAAGTVRHYLAPGQTMPQQYDDVDLVVDADKRKRNARWHTAGHLIAAVADECFPWLNPTDGHHWPHEARVQCDPAPEGADLPAARDRIAAGVKAAIAADLPVVIEGEPHGHRLIRIGSYDPAGCGGTHVANLAELGRVDITKLRHKNGSLRISYELA